MLRQLFRGRQRNVLQIARRSKPVAGQPAPQVLRIQHVRFKNRFRARNFFIAAGAYYFCYSVHTTILHNFMRKVDDLDDADDDDEEEDDAEDDDEVDQSELFFFPFPGTTKEVESPPYRFNDPEWQAFIKINKNPEVMKSIRNELAELSRIAVQNSLPPQSLGDLKIRQHWLTIQYPYKPSPTFVRSGISIRDDGSLEWLDHLVDSDVVFKTQHALWPSALVTSLWTFSTALLKQNTNAVAKSIGMDVQETPARLGGIKDQQPFKKTQKTPESDPPATPPRQDETSSTDAPLEKTTSAAPGTTTTPEAVGGGSKMGNIVPPAPSKAKEIKDQQVIRAASDHFSGPMDVLKKKLVETWRRPKSYPPRGAVYVSGLVEISTARGFVIIDARAWWDPQTKNFVPRTMQFGLRQYLPKQQSPRR
ncbi:hypothetical protein F5Y16DRAFT_422913 [Xylariaceae sp. FL0255]|nr:hypothetical protein F5Y16DRAFT_422913 [Xylariaceae sp. FL0255]